MLWNKSWMETRWRFLIGLMLLILSAAGIVLAYPRMIKLLPLVPTVDGGGELGRRIRAEQMRQPENAWPTWIKPGRCSW